MHMYMCTLIRHIGCVIVISTHSQYKKQDSRLLCRRSCSTAPGCSLPPDVYHTCNKINSISDKSHFKKYQKKILSILIARRKSTRLIYTYMYCTFPRTASMSPNRLAHKCVGPNKCTHTSSKTSMQKKNPHSFLRTPYHLLSLHTHTHTDRQLTPAAATMNTHKKTPLYIYNKRTASTATTKKKLRRTNNEIHTRRAYTQNAERPARDSMRN